MASPAFDYPSIFRKRLALLQLCQDSEEFCALEYEKCRRDKVHFITTWGMTFDPRRKPKNFPFMLYDFQVEMIRWIDARYELKELGLIEKSRDMGATWIVSAWAVHSWIFERGFNALFGSRKESLVDDFTLDSIFGKLRYLIQNLPWFLNPIYDVRQRSEWNRYLCLKNPHNGNQITGESANPGFGRGGRSSIVFLDEFAHVQHSEAVWASVHDNTDCLIPLSTPFGKGNQFGWLRHETDIKVLSLHWSKHPEKDKAWYDKKASTMKPHQIAQELDLSYDRSVAGRIYRHFDRRYHVAAEPIIPNIDFEQFITWDFGIADPTAILWGQITPLGGIEIWNEYQLDGYDIDFHAPVALGRAPKEIVLMTEQGRKYVRKVIERVPPGLNPTHYGDHAGTARTANSKRSCKTALASYGITLNTTGKQGFDWRIECLDHLMKLRHNPTRDEWYSVFTVSPTCTKTIDACFNYQYETDPEKLNDEKIKPKHDKYSHIMTALEFLAINRFPRTEGASFREEKVR